MQSNQSEFDRNYDFYDKATWQQVKPKIQAIIQQFQQQSKPQIDDLNSFYQNLEYDHSFIQWMFPNFYASRFNPNSYKLTLKEREKMIQSKTILQRFNQNYQLILRFFGIEQQDIHKNVQPNHFKDIDQSDKAQQQQINTNQIIIHDQRDKMQLNSSIQQTKTNEQKGKLKIILKNRTTIDQFAKNNKNTKQNFKAEKLVEKQQQTQNNLEIMGDMNEKILVLIDKNQFELCCLRNTHNLLRLKRILSSLSVLKHRKEAIKLCQFLKQELSNMGRQKIYDNYFSGFDKYYEELSEEDKKDNDKSRQFYMFKHLYVEEDLIDKIDISIIS